MEENLVSGLTDGSVVKSMCPIIMRTQVKSQKSFNEYNIPTNTCSPSSEVGGDWGNCWLSAQQTNDEPQIQGDLPQWNTQGVIKETLDTRSWHLHA